MTRSVKSGRKDGGGKRLQTRRNKKQLTLLNFDEGVAQTVARGSSTVNPDRADNSRSNRVPAVAAAPAPHIGSAVSAPTGSKAVSHYIYKPTWQTKSVPLRPRQASNADRAIHSLYQMLRYRRPKGSESETEFRRRFLETLPNMNQDAHGNMICIVGNPTPEVMWSSHTDSVHRAPGEQNIRIEGDYILLGRREERRADCLGADCASGVWMMREMILAGVPGLYIFHWGEESGGIGSKALAKDRPSYLENVKAAIAFDRYGFDSIITHQFGRRSASEAFSKSVASQLPGFKSDNGGTFTDTASYMHFIPECTNLSIGYLSQHTNDEAQSIEHLLWMREKMLAFDASKLVIERDPTKTEYRRYGEAYFGYGGYGSYTGGYNGRSRSNYKEPKHFTEASDEFLYNDDLYGHSFGFESREFEEDDEPVSLKKRQVVTYAQRPQSLAKFLAEYPEHCAAVLEECGYSTEDFIQALSSEYNIEFE